MVVSVHLRVLVAGSGGFIGAAVARRLRSDGMQVIEAGRANGVELSEPAHVAALPECDAVLHLAGRSHATSSIADAQLFHRDNVETTRHLLQLARRHRCRFVLAGSYVYGTPQYLPIDELHPTSSVSPYMASKLAAEQLCEAHHREHGTPVVVLRIFNAYGPRQREHLLVPTIASGLRRGSLRLGSATPRRDFVHIDDVAKAFAAVLCCQPRGFDVFNIGTGSSVSVLELVETMKRLSGSDCRVEYDTFARASDIPDVVADIGKAGRVLGWRPYVPLEAGLRSVLAETVAPRCRA